MWQTTARWTCQIVAIYGTRPIPLFLLKLRFTVFQRFTILFYARSVALDLQKRRLTRQFAIGEAAVALDRSQRHTADVSDLTVRETPKSKE
jgi:hypothetical protein